MASISKNKLKTLIEAHFENTLSKDTYTITKKKAIELLTHNRFDLAFKLFYLDMKNKNYLLAKSVYIEHIKAFSLGEFTEPGNENKNTPERFIEEFDQTFSSIKKNGFDSKQTLLPLSKDGSISNGAHRVASAIYLNKEVECVEIDSDSDIYDYQFFYERNVEQKILDIVATEFIKFASNVHIAFLWPVGKETNKKIENIIPNILYKKKIKLNHNGAHNLLSQIYFGEEWLGNIENNFAGTEGKLIECFKTFDAFDVIAFQSSNLEEVLKIKDRVRELVGVGKHSIHITDTRDEALRVANVIFNDNTLHFLNYAKPNKYLSTHKKLEKYRNFLKQNDSLLSDSVLDSGIVLSAYGLRECSDIDYFIDDNNKLNYYDEELESHDEELKFHDEDKLNMIYNPKYYFYFNDIKFISFTQLYKMKSNRAEEKDINDCKMMEALIENNKFKEVLNKFQQNIYYGKVKIKRKIINILKAIGLFDRVMKFYKSIKNAK